MREAREATREKCRDAHVYAVFGSDRPWMRGKSTKSGHGYLFVLPQGDSGASDMGVWWTCVPCKSGDELVVESVSASAANILFGWHGVQSRRKRVVVAHE